MRRFFRWLALLIAATLLLAACSKTDGPAPGTDNGNNDNKTPVSTTLTYVDGVDITTLDPAFATDRPTQSMLRHIFQGLVDTDPATGGVIKWLATDWKISDDKKEWTFTIQSGIKFSDGTPLNAAAVKKSLDRLLDKSLAAANASLLSTVTAIEAVNDTTVKIVTKDPFAPLLENLAHPGAAIVPPNFDPKNPIGSGPYKVKERQAGQKLVLERNEQFQGDKSAWSEIIFKPVTEPNARVAQLSTGEATVVKNIPPESVEQFKNHATAEILVKPSTFQISFEINTRMKPFDNPKVRRALNMAVDRDALIKGLLKGMGSVPAGPVPPGAQWPLKLQPYPYNPDEAKKLLAEAGVQPGMAVEIWTSQGRYAKDKEMAEAVASYLQAVGFKPEVKVKEWAAYVKEIEAKDKTAALYILGSSVPTLDWRLTRNFLSTSTNNLTGYSNPDVDKLLLEARTVFGDAERKALYDQVQTKVWEDAPYLFLFNQVQIFGQQKGVSGLTSYGHEIVDFTKTTMTK